MSRDADGGSDSTLSALAAQLSSHGRRVHVGTAIMPHLLDDPVYESLAAAHFDTIVCEHHHKWEPLLVTAPDGTESYDWSKSDTIVDWAAARGKAVKGHCLVWHVTSPKWIESAPASRVREAVYEHIKATMNHTLGRVYAWDVVNEPLHPDATGRLADTPFLRALGPSYIEDVLRVAHHTDPSARLIINENKAEGAGLPPSSGRSAKADALYTLCSDLVSRGAPLHEVGLQCHFDAAGTGLRRPPPPRALRRAIARLGALGLSVNISELDVRTAGLTLTTATGDSRDGSGGRGGSEASLLLAHRDAAAEAIMHDTLSAALREPAFSGVTFWGFADAHSWCHAYYGSRDRPLLWDEAYAPKRALEGVKRALREAALCAAQRSSGDSGDGDPDEGLAGDDEWGREWMLPEPAHAVSDAAAGAAGPVAGVAVDEPNWTAGQRDYMQPIDAVTAVASAKQQQPEER